MTHVLQEIIDSRFGGVLRKGEHEPDGMACALEAVSIARGVEWTDSPEVVGMPDLRPLNDGPWPSDEARTAALVPALIALWDWRDWDDERQRVWAQRVALRTIREVLPEALEAVGLPDHAQQCRDAEDLDAAYAAADAAAYAAADAAARAAAYAAAYAAADAARAAADAAADAADAAANVLELACRIWAEEAINGSAD